MSRIEMRKRKAAFENENNKKRKITRRQMDQEIAAKGVKNGDDLNDDWLIGYMNGDFDYPDVEIIEEEEDEKEDKDEETQEEKEDNVEDNDEEEEEGFVEIDGEIFIYCNCCFPPKKF